MSSQFDDLLGDFGGDTSSSATIKAGGDNSNGGAQDSGLLLDFGVGSTEATNGQTNGVDFGMDSSSSGNPLYDLSTNNDFEAQSSNPLYDFSVTTDTTTSSSGNPLYDLSTEESTDQQQQQQSQSDSGGALLDFGLEAPTTTNTDSANPLYDFDASSPMTTEEDPFQQQSSSSNNNNADFQTEDDFLSGGTNGDQTTTTTTAAATFSDDLLGDFNGNQGEPDQFEQQPEVAPDLDYSEPPSTTETTTTAAAATTESTDASGALFDLGPTDTSETTTTYQDEAPHTEEVEGEVEQPPPQVNYNADETEASHEGGADEFPDLVVREDGDEEYQPEPTQQFEEEEVQAEPAAPAVVQEEEEEVQVEPAAPGVVVQEEEEEEVQPEPQAAEEEYLEQEPEMEPEPEPEASSYGAGGEAAGEEQQPEFVEGGVAGERPDSFHCSGTEGEYHAERREEDLENYCMDREEETSEVSDGIGETASADYHRDPAAAATQIDESPEQEVRHKEVEEAGHAADQIAYEEPEEPTVPQAEKEEEEEQHVVEAQDPEQEEEEKDEPPSSSAINYSRSTSFTSSSSIVLLSSPISPLPQEPFGGRVSNVGIASLPAARSGAEPEEEVIQDGQTVSKSTRTENRYSTGSGYGDSSQDFSSSPVVQNSRHNEPAMKREPEPRVSQPATLYSAVDDEDDEEEEGVYENEPEVRSDLTRESDKKAEENLPAAGTAGNLRAKFMAKQQEVAAPTRSKREVTPPNQTQGGGEYVSEPRIQHEQYEGRAESGVFESEPVIDDDVVRSGAAQKDAVPERGYAKNVMAKFTQLESEKNVAVTSSSSRRELTPDRSARTEYVSEPTDFVERYEGKAESGVFESQPAAVADVVRSSEGTVETVPERGTAKSLANKFKQISEESSSPQASRGKRELTPDASGRVEFVSEPRDFVEKYEAKTESGVFENQPQEDADVVKSQHSVEEFVPERGHAKNVAARFKELESNAKSPPLSPGYRKEFTPPREDASSRASGVYESTPQKDPEVVTSSEATQEVMPEQGTARNIAQRFRQLEAENKSPPSAGKRNMKEFTPPPLEAGVYENQPDRFQAEYNRPAESGIMENTPVARDDVTKESEAPKHGEELPERGTARNLLSRWKQMESESSGKSPTGVRQKEFTPPREEPRIAQQSKSPRTPKSPPANGSMMDNGSVHPSELPGQYQPQNEPHVIESTPDQQRSDVYREADSDKSHGMPRKNTAKKMLARFQNIQAEANKDTPQPAGRESRKESESSSTAHETSTDSIEVETPDPAMQSALRKFEDPDKVVRSKSMKPAIQVEKCGACDKTVYAMERLEMNKRVYHRACFRCSQCKSVLTPKTFSINNEVIFCTTHYKQLFTRKGNYDEGFGRTQHKKRWSSNPNIHDAVNQEEAADSQQEVNS